MKCLVCKDIDLVEQEITSGLKVHKCNRCSGNWLRFGDYIEWRKNHYLDSREDSQERMYHPVEDSTNPKLCPDCERILAVYKVSNKLSFRIEHCASCYGVWFDKNEWENLEENDLHSQLEKFFTDSWQEKLRDEDRREYFDNFYRTKFGVEDYEKIMEVRFWLNKNVNKSMLLAFLVNEDPYKL
jgi:Uncharacterized protein conserved in bacteria